MENWPEKGSKFRQTGQLLEGTSGNTVKLSPLMSAEKFQKPQNFGNIKGHYQITQMSSNFLHLQSSFCQFPNLERLLLLY